MKQKIIIPLSLGQLLHIVILFISLFLFVSCEESAPLTAPKRSILVYIGGSNDLSGVGQRKLSTLMEGYERYAGDGKLVIFHDTKREDPYMAEVTRVNGKATLEDKVIFSGASSADPSVLARVVDRFRKVYQAESYGMIVFSHATGWLPSGSLAPLTRSIFEDSGDEMEIEDFSAALPDGGFDFIIFETCFMAGIEVLYELRNKADYIMASSAEILDPGFEVVYRAELSRLFEPQADLAGFMGKAFDYFNTMTGRMRSSTLSLIRTAALEELTDWVKNNIDWGEVKGLKSIQHFDRKKTPLFYDLEETLSSVCKSASQKAELSGLINRCILLGYHTPTFFLPSVNLNGFDITTYSGMTVYIPGQGYEELDEYHQGLRWTQQILRKRVE